MDNPEKAQKTLRTLQELSHHYFAKLLEERRRQPREDLISRLLVAEHEGKFLSEDELIKFCFTLFSAGHETTTNLLGIALVCLDLYPESFQRLRQEPARLIQTTVEEVLRYLPVIWKSARRTTSEVQVGKETLPANALVNAWNVSAHHDEAAFPDPDVFDIERTPNKHVGFGHGIHFCLGAPLARLEATIALPRVLELCPHLQLHRDGPLEMVNSDVTFGFKHIPVTFTAV